MAQVPTPFELLSRLTPVLAATPEDVEALGVVAGVLGLLQVGGVMLWGMAGNPSRKGDQRLMSASDHSSCSPPPFSFTRCLSNSCTCALTLMLQKGAIARASQVGAGGVQDLMPRLVSSSF